MGTAVQSKLFSTSAVIRLSVKTENKKNVFFSMPEARRLLSLAKPEKWKLFGKMLKLNVYGGVLV
jgi:phenylalanine-4-hydroxylase